MPQCAERQNAFPARFDAGGTLHKAGLYASQGKADVFRKGTQDCNRECECSLETHFGKRKSRFKASLSAKKMNGPQGFSLRAKEKSNEAVPFYKSKFDLYESKFEMYKSKFETYKSNFDL